MIALVPIAAPVTTSAKNLDCTLVVRNAPMITAGLVTAYQLKATGAISAPSFRLFRDSEGR